MSPLVMTPERNEVENMGALVGELVDSAMRQTLWVVSNDGTADGTTNALTALSPPSPREVVSCSRISAVTPKLPDTKEAVFYRIFSQPLLVIGRYSRVCRAGTLTSAGVSRVHFPAGMSN